jgi:lipopolysaccharide export system permease protein
MRRLTTYLARLFATDAIILIGIVCLLLWLVNCLRSFEIVSVKGQGFGTLAIQALYTMPPLLLSFFYICVGIGMVRALTGLQQSRELHIIHATRGITGLWRASFLVLTGAVAVVLLISHVIEPLANRRFAQLSASVAADLVSSTLRPGRFTQVQPGVVLLIGGRADGGEITDFFADDRRSPEARRTYIAESARVSSDGDNFILELRNGSLQYTQNDGRYSEVRFTRYDLSVETLSQPLAMGNSLGESTSFDLIGSAMETGSLTQDALNRLLDRTAEALRVIGIGLFTLAIAAFPSGRRARIPLPLEAIVLLVAFVERGVGTYSPLGSGTGSILMILVSAAVLAFKVWPRRPIAMVSA